jgi:hypothetical protein
MKKFFILLIALLIVNGAVAQSCLPEGITFSTQAEIDNFQTNYPNCTEIEGNVLIEGDNYNSITNLYGLSVLTSIGGYLQISYNALTSLTGLEGLTSIGGSVLIDPSYSLASLTGLDSLTSIGGILDIQNTALTSLTGLGNLTHIGGEYLHISNNEALVSLTGLEGLTSIGGGIYVDFTSSLTGLTGLNNLTSIGGGLSIAYNSALTSLTGLENLISIGNELWIYSNDNLTSLAGLNNLTSIGGNLNINYNPTLISLTGLGSLITIGGSLIIGSWLYGPINSDLTNLSGLDNLTTIGGNLEIKYNPNLTSLSGIDNINAGSIDNLYITDNPILSSCEVQSICNYLASPNGDIDIYSNATGCNSQQELQDACHFGLDDNKEKNQLNVYPNPVSDQFTIIFTLERPVWVSLEVYNRLGKIVAIILDESMPQGELQLTWKTDGLTSGIYFYRLTAGSQSSTGKLVVVR